jgi:hypothetical protein
MINFYNSKNPSQIKHERRMLRRRAELYGEFEANPNIKIYPNGSTDDHGPGWVPMSVIPLLWSDDVIKPVWIKPPQSYLTPPDFYLVK